MCFSRAWCITASLLFVFTGPSIAKNLVDGPGGVSAPQDTHQISFDIAPQSQVSNPVVSATLKPSDSITYTGGVPSASTDLTIKYADGSSRTVDIRQSYKTIDAQRTTAGFRPGTGGEVFNVYTSMQSTPTAVDVQRYDQQKTILPSVPASTAAPAAASDTNPWLGLKLDTGPTLPRLPMDQTATQPSYKLVDFKSPAAPTVKPSFTLAPQNKFPAIPTDQTATITPYKVYIPSSATVRPNPQPTPVAGPAVTSGTATDAHRKHISEMD